MFSGWMCEAVDAEPAVASKAASATDMLEISWNLLVRARLRRRKSSDAILD